ncbi:MAG TPA: glycosyltransferase family 4 protein [Xanthobacteraceae bacterium]|jgi:glycosyltransferase involved in cell wall biosynthesis|nr:glycosyltransferase family 4 protein [Xanthobacteraceae bacterium]
MSAADVAVNDAATDHETANVPRTLPGATVLQIAPASGDDYITHSIADVATALLRSGARVIVAGGKGALANELQGMGVEYISFEAASKSRRRRGNAFEELIATERIDLIHARGADAVQSAAAIASQTGAWLVASHVSAGRTDKRDGKTYLQALDHAHRIVVHSHFAAQQLIRRSGFPRERIAVVPRRIDTATFDPAAVEGDRVAALRRAWKIRTRERIMLLPGRIDPAKGQHVIVDAARLLVNGGLHEVVFVLAGDDRRHPAYAREIAALAAAQGIDSMIRRVGFCPDMPAAYLAADLVIVPAIEPPTFGRVAAEALAMGRPVVASATGALPEFILTPPRVAESARIGWLFNPEDSFDLARAIADAEATDTENYRAMSERARRQAERSFGPTHIASAMLGVYAALLEGR